jgi:hypothetical protein
MNCAFVPIAVCCFGGFSDVAAGYYHSIAVCLDDDPLYGGLLGT